MAVSITIAELSFALAGNLTRMGVNLANAEAVTDADAARLLPVATALVERFAPGAPAPVQNEAVIRVSGWLSQQPSDSRSSESFNVLGVDFSTAHNASAISPMRASGAMALLSPWKKRSGTPVSGTAPL